VKLRSKQFARQLATLFEAVARGDFEDSDSPFSEITDEDIDSLFD
jgi:hypothetical protein